MINLIKNLLKDKNRLPTYEESKKYDYTFKEPLLEQDEDLPTYEQVMFEKVQTRLKEEKLKEENKLLEEHLIKMIESGKNIDWFYISEKYTLSEDFIRRYKNNVCWYDIKRCQKLSNDFKYEFKDILKKFNNLN